MMPDFAIGSKVLGPHLPLLSVVIKPRPLSPGNGGEAQLGFLRFVGPAEACMYAPCRVMRTERCLRLTDRVYARSIPNYRLQRPFY
jgi:hypothetical protein